TVRKDGTILPVISSATAIRDSDGNYMMSRSTVYDITELKRAEEQLRLSHEQLRNLYAHLHIVREQERTYIARELHDQLVQTLMALNMDISWVEQKCGDHEKLLDRTRSMTESIGGMIKTVKRILFDLRPWILEHLGLPAAIEVEAKKFQEATGIRCEVRIRPANVALEDDLSMTNFRILQEVLTNVIPLTGPTKV